MPGSTVYSESLYALLPIFIAVLDHVRHAKDKICTPSEIPQILTETPPDEKPPAFETQAVAEVSLPL